MCSKQVKEDEYYYPNKWQLYKITKIPICRYDSILVIDYKKICHYKYSTYQHELLIELKWIWVVKYSFDLVNCDMFMHRNASNESETYKVGDAEAITHSKRRERVELT